MNKIIKSSALFISLIVVLVGCASTGGESENNIDLIASSGLSDQHILHLSHYQPVMDRVEEETNNQVSFTAYTSGELVNLGDEYQALEQGTIDVALSFMSQYDSSRFPYSEVTLLPTLKADVHIATEAVSNLMKSDREIEDGKTFYELTFEDKGLVAFANIPTEAYVLSTTGHRFESVEDFNQSVQLRSSSRVHNMLLGNIGLSSISMPITEAFDALSRNTLDGLLYNIPDWKSIGFDELMKYTIEGVNMGHFFQQTVILEETWEQLPSDVQEIYRNAQEELIFEGTDLTDEDATEMRESNMEHGGEFVDYNELPSPVVEHIEQAVVQTWYDWIDDLESNGLNGTEMAKLWRDLFVEAGGEVPSDIMDLN